MQVHMRWMVSPDLPEVLKIEQQSFDSPWEDEDFRKWWRQRNVIDMVAEYKGRVVGFITYALYKRSLHLINMAVTPRYRGRGIGRQMIMKLIEKIKTDEHRSRITVPASMHWPYETAAPRGFLRQCDTRNRKSSNVIVFG